MAMKAPNSAHRSRSRLVRGGILILDDYGNWAGATQAVDEYFKDRPVTIRQFPFCQFPSYIIKE